MPLDPKGIKAVTYIWIIILIFGLLNYSIWRIYEWNSRVAAFLLIATLISALTYIFYMIGKDF